MNYDLDRESTTFGKGPWTTFFFDADPPCTASIEEDIAAWIAADEAYEGDLHRHSYIEVWLKSNDPNSETPYAVWRGAPHDYEAGDHIAWARSLPAHNPGAFPDATVTRPQFATVAETPENHATSMATRQPDSEDPDE